MSRVKFDCRCTLKVITDLELPENKKELMRDSQFSKLLDVENKSTSNYLVHRFLETYNVEKGCFQIQDRDIYLESKDISRITGLNATGIQYEKPKVTNAEIYKAMSWYVALCDNLGIEIPQEVGKKKGSNLALCRKSEVSKVLKKMAVGSDDEKTNFKKLLSFYLANFFNEAPADDKGAAHYFVTVDDLEKFEKICWAKAMLDNIIHCATNVVKKNQKYITCPAPVVEALMYDQLPEIFHPHIRSEWKEGMIVLNKFRAKTWHNNTVQKMFLSHNPDGLDQSCVESVVDRLNEDQATSFLYRCFESVLGQDSKVSISDVIKKMKATYFGEEASNLDLLLKLHEGDSELLKLHEGDSEPSLDFVDSSNMGNSSPQQGVRTQLDDDSKPSTDYVDTSNMGGSLQLEGAHSTDYVVQNHPLIRRKNAQKRSPRERVLKLC